MLINTDHFKTEKEIAELYGKFPASVNRSIKRHEAATGIPLPHIKAFGLTLYDIRNLPESITGKRGKNKEEGEAGAKPTTKE